MSQLIVYHYPKCGTCRSAVKWLKEQGHELELRHIVEQTPGVDELSSLAKASGLELKKFFNTSGEVYKRENLKEKLPSLDDREKLEMLAGNGMLIKRPIVVSGDKVTVGFKEEDYRKAWGNE
ncbi:arsenate reductase family protein [Paenibacillus sabinae]|uniref:Arsenate reductase-like protein n=1 Tax=Paenibacillus sabinae T27 TaxID=1268072 RepID=X4ZGK2_9BACL|nr:arsenate reductase family protein [Paenibacillus sabinae]AHV96552.1 arsenate reductase-like protein [Paenibacillus sabinae T27]